VPGRGSAIFLHLAKPTYSHTQGCVALAYDDAVAAIGQLKPGDQVVIG
jgi:L,D-peptidoglycan transpeptidase YkuD (ErfK/YbiS/YcfS/YnhG family)